MAENNLPEEGREDGRREGPFEKEGNISPEEARKFVPANYEPPSKVDDYDWEGKVGAQKWRLRPTNPRWARLIGCAVSQIVGFFSLAIVVAFFNHFDVNKVNDVFQWTASLLGFSHFFLIPFGMGFVQSYFWLDLKRSGPFGATFWNCMLSCLLATFVLREGVICLFMASWILWAAMAVGFSIGNRFWQNNPFLNVSLVPIFLMLTFLEATYPTSSNFVATTDYHSSASPAQLWRYTTNYPRNTQPKQGFLFSLGMPAPESCQGSSREGGRRDCNLSGGVNVGAKVVIARPNESIDFVFDRQPKHPEVTHHFILQRGRIDLIPDGKGGTVIRGTSWYRLNVAPLTYFRWWTDSAVHTTHWRVFKWMDELAKRDARMANAPKI